MKRFSIHAGRNRRWACLLLTALLSAGTAAQSDSDAQRRTGVSGRSGGFALPLDAGGPIRIRAEDLSYDGAMEWAEASGNVQVHTDGQSLHADRARLNSTTGDIEAWGNIVLDRGPDGVWRGDYLKYNFRTREGLTKEMDFDVEPFIVRTATTASMPDGKIHFEHAWISTCTNAPGHEHYQIRARQAKLQPGEYISMHGVTLRLFGVPLIYTPWLYRGLRADEGWRFDPGYSTRMGAFLLSTYRRRVIEWDDGGWMRSRTRLDYRTRRGFALGQGFDWESDSFGEGEAYLYMLQDQRPYDNDRPRDRLDENRYRGFMQHVLNTSPQDRWQFQADLQSDDYFLRDFFGDEYRRRRHPDTFASYTHRAPDYTAGGLMRLRLNDFQELVERLPEVWFDLMRREVLAEGLYYESQNRLSLLRRRHDDLSEREDYDTWRADSNHLLAYPFKTYGFLQLVPRAGARATYYGDTLRTETEIETVTITETNALGQVTVTTSDMARQYQVPAGADLRLRLELGMEASFRAYRMFQVGERDWRHVAEPYADYTLVPEPTLTPDQLYQFDDVDRLAEVHGVKIGFRNLLQTRAGGGVVNVADVDAHATYKIAREPGEDAFDQVFLDARFFPDDWLRMDSRGVFSLRDTGFVSLDTRLHAWRSPFWALTTEHNYRVDRRNAVYGSLTFSPRPGRTFNLFGRYDYHNGEIEEQGGYVQLAVDCLAMRLGGYVQPGYTLDDGSKRETDYRVLLHVWLTAFPPENLDRRYRQ